MDVHRQPDADEPFDLLGEDDAPDLLNPDHLKGLACDIEARFAEERPPGKISTK